jgi:PiT family inorganic phosphate transporter
MEYSTLLIITIVFALVFDFINGFHDAANSVATIVATQVLKPHWAVIWAAFFNFIAFLFFELKVASTIGKGVIDPHIVDTTLILSTLIGAVVWNLVTWYWGLPSSSSHALIGGLVGTGIAKAGTGALNLEGLTKIGFSIVGSPLFGLILGFLMMKLVRVLVMSFKPKEIDGWFRKLQLVSASLYSLGHGGNDAQKTMGIITVLLVSSGHLQGDFKTPFWVVISCQLAMGLGTLFGGWKIVKTMGMKLTKLKPIGGFCAETSGAATLFLATSLGIPVSTTHTITGSIVGVGAADTIKKVKWNIAGRIVWAWIFTIPAAATIGAISYLILK